MPTQRPAASEPPTLRVVAPSAEEVIQFSLSLQKGLRKQLARLADEADMTMRAFVLDALKAKGLDVRPEDLADLRKALSPPSWSAWHHYSSFRSSLTASTLTPAMSATCPRATPSPERLT